MEVAQINGCFWGHHNQQGSRFQGISVGWVRTDVPLAHPQLHPHQEHPGIHPVPQQSWEPAGNGEDESREEQIPLLALPGMQEDPGILAVPQDGSGCAKGVPLGAELTAIPIY